MTTIVAPERVPAASVEVLRGMGRRERVNTRAAGRRERTKASGQRARTRLGGAMPYLAAPSAGLGSYQWEGDPLVALGLLVDVFV
jgi:hypothetical protein